MHLFKIGFSRLPQTLTDKDKILQAELKSHVLKFWHHGPKERKMTAKKKVMPQ